MVSHSAGRKFVSKIFTISGCIAKRWQSANVVSRAVAEMAGNIPVKCAILTPSKLSVSIWLPTNLPPLNFFDN